jgi:hypothetical protein
MHKKRCILCKISYTFIAFFAVVSLFLCGEYNPFSDNTNAKATTLNPSNTIETRYIFTTDSIKLLLTVCNLIEKVKVTADSNRYIKNLLFTDLCKYNGSITLTSSFYDTGYHEIKIITYHANGDSITERKRFYILSDLKQEDLLAMYGSDLKFKASTTEKHDKDIKYVWEIGKNTYKSIHDSTTIIYKQLSNDSGTLKMCDLEEQCFSPPVYFKISLSDTVQPSIIIKNEMSNDTLYVSTSSLILQIQIEKIVGKYTLVVDGDTLTSIGSNYFIKTINNTKLEDSVKTLKIYLIDISKNTSPIEKTLYVLFNSKNQKDIKPSLKIIGIPDTDVVVVQSPVYTLNGQVVFNANNVTMYTVSLFHGNTLKNTTNLFGSFTCNWGFMLDLEKEHNFFRIEVKDSLSNIVDDTTLHFYYCTNCVDTEPPVIASVLVNKDTLLADESYTSNSRKVRIELVCFDLGKGIKSVMVGSSTLARDSNTSHRWLLEREVSHITHPDTLIFSAVDLSEHKSDKKKVVIGYNTPPYLYSSPSTITHAFVGIPYVDSIVIRDDDDGDYITYSILPENNKLKMHVDEKGKIQWTPGKSDTGLQKIKIYGYDQNNEVAIYSYNIFVSSKTLDTVRFSTSREVFPEVISCDDSLNIVLNVIGGTGPFEYTITDLSNNEEIAIDQKTHLFKWKPECTADTGGHQFFILVRDKLRLSDTLWPVIKVLPKNQPFELTEKWTGVKKNDTILDLSKNLVDTLLYTIKDPDDPVFEKHTIQISLGVEKYSIEASSSQFFIPLDPKRKLSGRDSLLVVVTDNGGNKKKIRKLLDYGSPPKIVQILNPLPGELFESKDIQFRWSCSDPDGEKLSYTFSLVFNNGIVIEKRSSVQDTSIILSGLKMAGAYSWSVIAADSKSVSESSMGKFNFYPPDRIKIDTAVSKINKEFINCGDTIKIPVVLKNGYPPYKLAVNTNVSVNPPTIEGGSMVWVPQSSQAGKYQITLTVVDSVGNTDAFTYPLLVYGSDSLNVVIANSVKRNEYNEIDLSNPLVKEVPCTLLIKDPDPSPPEIFTISVMLGGIGQEFYKTVERTIGITLKTESTKLRDTLSVTVTDMKGKTFTLTDMIYYGN